MGLSIPFRFHQSEIREFEAFPKIRLEYLGAKRMHAHIDHMGEAFVDILVAQAYCNI